MRIKFLPDSGLPPANAEDWFCVTDATVPVKGDTVALPTGDEDQKDSFFVVTYRVFHAVRNTWVVYVKEEGS